MATFLKLTQLPDDQKVLINLEHVEMIKLNISGGTRITFNQGNSDFIVVREPLEAFEAFEEKIIA